MADSIDGAQFVDEGESNIAARLRYTADINANRFDDHHPLVAELREAANLIDRLSRKHIEADEPIAWHEDERTHSLYQVIGNLATAAGVFDDPAVVRALDLAAYGKTDDGKDVLPFAPNYPEATKDRELAEARAYHQDALQQLATARDQRDKALADLASAEIQRIWTVKGWLPNGDRCEFTFGNENEYLRFMASKPDSFDVSDIEELVISSCDKALNILSTDV